MMKQRRVIKRNYGTDKSIGFALAVITEMPDGRKAAVHLEVFDLRHIGGPMESMANLVTHIQMPRDYPGDNGLLSAACDLVGGKCEFDSAGVAGMKMWDTYGKIEQDPDNQPEELWVVLEQFLEVHVQGVEQP